MGGSVGVLLLVAWLAENALWLVGAAVLLLYGWDMQRRQGISLFVRPTHWRAIALLGSRIVMLFLGLWLIHFSFSKIFQQSLEEHSGDWLTYLLSLGLTPLVLGIACFGIAVPGVRLLSEKWRESFFRMPLPWVLAMLLGGSIYMHYRALGWHERFCWQVQQYVALERHSLTGKDLDSGNALRLETEKSSEGVRYRLLMQLESASEKFCGQGPNYIFPD